MFRINATLPPHWRHQMCSDSVGFLLKPRDHDISWHPWVGGQDLNLILNLWRRSPVAINCLEHQWLIGRPAAQRTSFSSEQALVQNSDN